jgi:type II secretory pathway component PulJ
VTGRRLSGDAGVTLAEVLMSMAIMTVVGALFTAAVAQAYRVTNTVDARAQAQAQIRLAVQRLDQQIRYAYDMTTPSTPEEAIAAAGTWYVEYLRVVDTAGTQQCNQLRLRDGHLMLRRWTPGALAAIGQTRMTLAVDIDMSAFATASAADATVPFQVQDVDSKPFAQASARASFSPEFQRLRVRLVTKVGQQGLSSDVTFTALNTKRDTDPPIPWPTADVCRTEGRPWT